VAAGGHRKIFEVMTSTLPKGTLDLVAYLLAVTLYQGNPVYGTLWYLQTLLILTSQVIFQHLFWGRISALSVYHGDIQFTREFD
jgi:hypothetical protein